MINTPVGKPATGMPVIPAPAVPLPNISQLAQNVVSSPQQTPPTVAFDDNLAAAHKDLGLSPQEQFLYNYHLNNLRGTGKIENEDGSISTIKNITAEINGRTYIIPTVRNGQFLEPRAAIAAAAKDGLSNYPSYATEQEASDRYDAMHAFMDKDMVAYTAASKKKKK